MPAEFVTVIEEANPVLTLEYMRIALHLCIPVIGGNIDDGLLVGARPTLQIFRPSIADGSGCLDNKGIV